MKRLFVKSIIVFFAVAASLTAFAQQKKVAVLNPICRDNSVSSIYFSVVRGSFESVASATDGFEVYNRTDLDAIASEMRFQQSGAVDDAQIRKIGKMAGVDFVLVTVLSADEGYLMVESKILNVESSQYDRAASKLMNMTPPIVEKTCLELAQSLFKINMSSGIQNGEIMYNGYRYIGEYKNGKPHGKGKLYYNTSVLSIYEGDFEEGLRHGYGKLVWNNGQRYEGNWKYDKQEGNGTFYSANGNKYVGNWNNGLSSAGTLYYTTGNKYVGNWSDYKRQGDGTMFYANGDKLVGYWSNDEIITGTYYWVNGSKYVGEWNNGIRSGKGKQYDSKGKLFYDGEWRDDVFEGVGKIYWTDTYWYSGEFQKGKQWGKGVEYHSGYKEEGYWLDGDKHGQFKIVHDDGIYEVGRYENGKKKGTWSSYSKDGNLRYKLEY